MNICLQVRDANRVVQAEVAGINDALLVYRQAYAADDSIHIELEAAGVHIVVCLDAGVPMAQVFLAGTRFVFKLPMGDERKAYSPSAFSGELHRISVRIAEPQEIAAVRNLALNPYDNNTSTMLFPHCDATAVTPGQAAMAARNVIDGERASAGHGRWPYTSWGINKDPDAALLVCFGRTVCVRWINLVLRADFPHDAWWERASLSFSGGEEVSIELTKTGGAQRVDLSGLNTDWVRLHSLIKADDPSPFPALTQIEVWGSDTPN